MQHIKVQLSKLKAQDFSPDSSEQEMVNEILSQFCQRIKTYNSLPVNKKDAPDYTEYLMEGFIVKADEMQVLHNLFRILDGKAKYMGIRQTIADAEKIFQGYNP